MSDDLPTGSTLRESAISGAKWIAIGRVLAEVGGFVTLFVVARLLTPAEVGAAALPLVIASLSSGLLGGGVGSSLVKTRQLNRAKIETAVYLGILVGAIGALLCLGAAVVLGEVVGQQTRELVVLAAPTFLLGSVAAVAQALRTRRLAFRSLMIIESIATLTGSASTIVLALLGFGPASLVGAVVVTTLMIGVLSVPGSGITLPRYHHGEAGEIARFGVPTSASSLLNVAGQNIDYALLTGRLPATDVGLYFRAYTLAFDYQKKFSQIVVRLLFPLLSRTESDRFDAVRGRVVRLHTVVLFPLLGLLAITAPDLIPVLLGDQWLGVITPVQILAAGGAAMAIGTGIGPVMLAAGRPKAMLYNNLISVACFALVVIVAAGHGLIAVCVVVSAYRLIALILSQYVLSSRMLGIPLRRTLITDPGPAATSTGVMAAVALPLAGLLRTAGAPDVVTLLAVGSAGLAVYMLALRTLFRHAWADLAMVGGGMLPGRVKRLRARVLGRTADA